MAKNAINYIGIIPETGDSFESATQNTTGSLNGIDTKLGELDSNKLESGGYIGDAQDLKDEINLKAPINSPIFTGNPQAPTPSLSDSDTSVATIAFVKSIVDNKHTFDTIADAQAYTGFAIGDIVEVLGYYEKGVSYHQRKIESTNKGGIDLGGGKFSNPIPLFNGEYDVKMFGAKGDGNPYDEPLIQLALNTAGTQAKSLKLSDGEYLLTLGLSSGGCQKFYGNKYRSVLKTTNESILMYNFGLEKSMVEGIKFKGTRTNHLSDGNLTQIGVNISNQKRNCTVKDCIFEDINGIGVYCAEIGTSRYGHTDGANIDNCEVYNSWRGVFCASNAEYVNINNLVAQDQTMWAIWTVAGNTKINSPNITKCQHGIYLGNAGNGQHSSIVGGNINHIFTDNGDETYTTGVGLFIDGVTLGEKITGLAMFDCDIYILNSLGIEFSDCILAIREYRFKGSVGKIKNCSFYRGYGHTIISNHEGVPSFIEFNDNHNFDGTNDGTAENVRGAMVFGAVTGGQVSPAGSANLIVDLTAQAYTGFVANNTFKAWWNDSTNKAKNFGYGGGRLSINFQCYITFTGSVSPTSVTQVILYVGTKKFICSTMTYGTSVYYSFNGEVYSDIGDDIYFEFINGSGFTATITSTNSQFRIEGL